MAVEIYARTVAPLIAGALGSTQTCRHVAIAAFRSKRRDELAVDVMTATLFAINSSSWLFPVISRFSLGRICITQPFNNEVNC